MALPPPPSPPPPPHPKPPQDPSPPRATATAHLGASPSRSLLSPPHQKIGAGRLPPLTPVTLPHIIPAPGTRRSTLCTPKTIPPTPAFPADGCHPALCLGAHLPAGAASETPPLPRSPAPSAPSGPTCAGRSRPRYRAGRSAPGAARWRPTSGTDGGDTSPFARGHPGSLPPPGSRPHPGCPRAKSDVLRTETPEGAVGARREKSGRGGNRAGRRRRRPGWGGRGV